MKSSFPQPALILESITMQLQQTYHLVSQWDPTIGAHLLLAVISLQKDAIASDLVAQLVYLTSASFEIPSAHLRPHTFRCRCLRHVNMLTGNALLAKGLVLAIDICGHGGPYRPILVNP